MKHLLLAAIIISSTIASETHAAVQGRLWYNTVTGTLFVGKQPVRNRKDFIPVTLEMLKGPPGQDVTVTPELLEIFSKAARSPVPVTPCDYSNLEGKWSFNLAPYDSIIVAGTVTVNAYGMITAGKLMDCDASGCTTYSAPVTGNFLQFEPASCKFAFSINEDSSDLYNRFVGFVDLDANKSGLAGSAILRNFELSSTISFTKIP